MDAKISKRGLDRAGKTIREHGNDEEYRAAIQLLNRWREQHLLPMDYYFDECVELAKKMGYEDTLVAQRLKRLPTIIDKLDRFPNMHLSAMQDIGGVRVILEDVENLQKFAEKIRELPILKHEKDYLVNPKETGYRGRHLIFESDGFLTEIQLRTQLQHLWATSVETIDVIRGTEMKTRGVNDYWREFFNLVSSAFAYMEGLPVLPQHQDMDIDELRRELEAIMRENLIRKSLKLYAMTEKVLDRHKLKPVSYYAVLSLNEEGNSTEIGYYAEEKYGEAVEDYESREVNARGKDSVMVSVNDLQKLREAYPNYFRDITRFAKMIEITLDFRK